MIAFPEYILPLLLILLCLIALSWFAGTDAPYVPTKIELILKVLKKAGVKRGKKFYELGSGDGRVVLFAARLGAVAVGIEQSLLRVIYSKYQAYKSHLPKAHFIHSNIFKHHYGDADIIYIFLLPQGVKRLEVKLQQELNKGVIVITQRYHFPNWKPVARLGEFNLYRL